MGTKLVFLSGHEAGRTAEVVADEWGTCIPGEFYAHMAGDQPNVVRRVIPGRDLYLDTSLFGVPAWMPPLSIEDNAALHDAVSAEIWAMALADDADTFRRALLPVILQCWHRRLPVSGTEVWLVLAAHSVPEHFKSDANSAFYFGIKLLTDASGRPPVKRRRMKPMSQGRYLTKGQRLFWRSPLEE